MRPIDETGLKLCRMQAEIFAGSLSGQACSSLIFIRRFMNSRLAQRMDMEGFLFEACDLNAVFVELDEEYGVSSYGREKLAPQVLYWIGYLYRYWCYTRQKTSRQVYRIIKPRELRELYFPYHSLDPAQAIERILEAKSLTETDLTQKGVELLRKAIRHERR